MDLFDCVMPSRNARHAHLNTWSGIRNLMNAKYTRDDRLLTRNRLSDLPPSIPVAYLHHLFKANEMLAMRLAVMHNLYFYNTLMEKIREALDNGTFGQFREIYSEKLAIRI